MNQLNGLIFQDHPALVVQLSYWLDSGLADSESDKKMNEGPPLAILISLDFPRVL